MIYFSLNCFIVKYNIYAEKCAQKYSPMISHKANFHVSGSRNGIAPRSSPVPLGCDFSLPPLRGNHPLDFYGDSFLPFRK